MGAEPPTFAGMADAYKALGVPWDDDVVAKALAYEEMDSCQRKNASCPGTDGPERIIGTNAADHINGQGGDDFLEGAGGNDDLNGGRGRDSLFGRIGDDHLDVVVADAAEEGVAAAPPVRSSLPPAPWESSALEWSAALVPMMRSGPSVSGQDAFLRWQESISS